MNQPLVKATSRSAIFRACKYAIKDTDDVLPTEDGRDAHIGNFSFEFCPLQASHARKSLSQGYFSFNYFYAWAACNGQNSKE